MLRSSLQLREEYARGGGSLPRGRAFFRRMSATPSRLSPLDPLRVGEHLHGHLGWLAAIALVHPAIFLRRADRRARWSVGLAVALVTLAGAIGVSLYPGYRDTLKQSIFVSSPTMGYLFERKEHLAFGAVMLAWTGGIGYVAERLSEGNVRAAMRRVAHYAFVAAAAFAVVTAALGTVVASYKTF